MSPMHESANEAVELRLLPAESTYLLEALEALESLSDELGDTFPGERLAPVLDRLDDSRAAAAWLGEYVRLELQPDEAVDLLEAVVTALNGDVAPPQEAGVALTHVGEKLATFDFGRSKQRSGLD